MSPRLRRLAIAAGAAAALGVVPGVVSAHALGGTYQLPVPLWLYLVGAAAAVGASFVVTAVLDRGEEGVPYAARAISPGPAGVARTVLRVLGLVWWYGAIGVGFVVGDISPLPGVLLWIGIWVGVPIASALIGNPWPALSPFRTTFAGVEWLARRLGVERADVGLAYPEGLARWPAVALLALGVLTELRVLLPDSPTALSVAVLMSAYTAFTMAGMIAFGQISWLRNVELFEVLLAWLGRIGPIGRRAVDADLCEGCRERCAIARCIDCPECSTAADDAERRPILRPWFAGLTDVVRAGWSDAAFIVMLLAGVSYDGMRETAFGARVLDILLPPMISAFGVTQLAFLVTETVAFAALFAAFLAVFAAARHVGGILGGRSRSAPGASASTLLPIAAGYLIAHYLTLVIQGAVWLPALVRDPLNSLAPQLDWIPTGLIWYASVAAIVGGHIAGIVLSHRLARRDAGRRATIAGLPMVALMIGYTILSLWIIAQPIVVEPGVTPAAIR